MERQDRAGGVIAVLFVFIALGAMAEVVAGRAVAPAPEAPASSWEPPLRVGDEARLRGDAPAARQAYLTALFRARGERSLDGVMRAAEAFADLGDREVAEHAVRMAVALDGHTLPESATRLRLLRDRLAATAALPATGPLSR